MIGIFDGVQMGRPAVFPALIVHAEVDLEIELFPLPSPWQPQSLCLICIAFLQRNDTAALPALFAVTEQKAYRAGQPVHAHGNPHAYTPPSSKRHQTAASPIARSPVPDGRNEEAGAAAGRPQFPARRCRCRKPSSAFSYNAPPARIHERLRTAPLP